MLDQTRVRASVATGYNRFYEKYGNFGTDVLDITGAGDEIESTEVDQSGLEVELFSETTESLTGSAGYMRVLDLQAIRADGTKVNGNVFWDDQATSVPENRFSLRLDYRVTDDVGIWGAAYHSTGYGPVDADGGMAERDGFTRLDLGVGWKATDQLGFRFRVENLLDERDFGQTVKGVSVNDEGKLGWVFWIGTD